MQSPLSKGRPLWRPFLLPSFLTSFHAHSTSTGGVG
nr:MAG TPA: hypothetical protein [Caudoviricetes sp.]